MNPISWYFTRGVFTCVTAPLFLWLVYGVIASVLNSFIQAWALVWVVYGVFGGLFAVGLAVFFGPIALSWVFFPAILYGRFFVHLPELWSTSTAGLRRTGKAFGAFVLMTAMTALM